MPVPPARRPHRDTFRLIQVESLTPVHGGWENIKLEECDLCHDYFPLYRTSSDTRPPVRYTGRQFLCAHCDGP